MSKVKPETQLSREIHEARPSTQQCPRPGHATRTPTRRRRAAPAPPCSCCRGCAALLQIAHMSHAPPTSRPRPVSGDRRIAARNEYNTVVLSTTNVSAPRTHGALYSRAARFRTRFYDPKPSLGTLVPVTASPTLMWHTRASVYRTVCSTQKANARTARIAHHINRSPHIR